MCITPAAVRLQKHLENIWREISLISILPEQKQKSQINQDAVRLMKQLYGIDMEQSQYSKTIDKIPTPDIAISMGCDVGCPYIGRAFDDKLGTSRSDGQK